MIRLIPITAAVTLATVAMALFVAFFLALRARRTTLQPLLIAIPAFDYGVVRKDHE